MNTETPDPTSSPEPEPEPVEDTTPKGPSWEYRKGLRINERLREVVLQTKNVTELEVNRLRRKLEKLTYGS